MFHFDLVESHAHTLCLLFAHLPGVGHYIPVGALGPVHVDGPMQFGNKVVIVPGLGHKILGTLLHGLDGQLNIAESRDEHHRGSIFHSLDTAKPKQTVGTVETPVVKIHVKQNSVHIVLLKQRREQPRVAHSHNLVKLLGKHQFQCGSHRLIVIYYQVFHDAKITLFNRIRPGCRQQMLPPPLHCLFFRQSAPADC